MVCTAPQVRPPLQQVGGEAVAHHVRRQAVKNPRLAPVPGQQLPECLPGQAPPRAVTNRYRLARPFSSRGRPFSRYSRTAARAARPTGTSRCLLPLPSHPQDAHFQVQVGSADPAQLGNPQTGGVEQFEHGAVPQAVRGGPRPGARNSRSISSRFKYLGMFCHCRGELRCSVGSVVDHAFGQQESIKIAERGEVPCDGPAPQPRAI